ncbi:MAG: hypothetical protein QNJ98_19140 [Planctomycetota bacterium]|nr:hypothetical protein [Planctomycetota bacterium]
MRIVPLLLLVAVLGLGLWYVLGGFDEDPATREPAEDTEATEPDPEAERMEKRFGLKTGTLSVIVRTIDGQSPLMAEVGYLMPGGKPRWLVAEGGRRVITDAPLGRVTAIARAPGYARVEQPCEVVAGVRADVVITLRPGDMNKTDPDAKPGG